METDIYASMHRVRFKPTTAVFERRKIIHALDRAATALSEVQYSLPKLFPWIMLMDINRAEHLFQIIVLLWHHCSARGQMNRETVSLLTSTHPFSGLAYIIKLENFMAFFGWLL
jgi:hypothetical protein